MLCWALPHALTGGAGASVFCWAGCCSSTTGAGAAGISSSGCLGRGGPRAHWFPVTAGAPEGAGAGAGAGFAARCCCGAASGALAAGAALGSVTFVGDLLLWILPLPAGRGALSLSCLGPRCRSLFSRGPSRGPSTRLPLGAGAAFFLGSFLVLVSQGQPARTQKRQAGQHAACAGVSRRHAARGQATANCDAAGHGGTHVGARPRGPRTRDLNSCCCLSVPRAHAPRAPSRSLPMRWRVSDTNADEFAVRLERPARAGLPGSPARGRAPPLRQARCGTRAARGGRGPAGAGCRTHLRNSRRGPRTGS